MQDSRANRGAASDEPGSISSTLFDRIKAGQPEAWERLAQLYGPVVYRWCRRSGVMADDVADVVQEVFVAVATYIREFRRDRPGSTFGGWLRTITKNKVNDHFRRHQRQAQAQGGSSAQQRLSQIPGRLPVASDTDQQSGDEMAIVRGVLQLVRAEVQDRTWQAFWRVTVKPTDPTHPAKRLKGTPFGGYQLLYPLSRRGSGDVFKAKHRTMGRTVALKVLSPEVMKSPERAARFQRKVKILAQLDHPNLVAAYDAGEYQGRYFLIMEYVKGLNLWSLLQQDGPFPVAEAVNYIAQAAAGLGYLHAQGIYHRNVKPSNLMLDLHGRVKVIGLGCAHVDFDRAPSAADLGDELTRPGQVMGTLDYMAPEQSVDSRRVDHRADIYALGCTLFTILIGRPPYPVKSPMKKLLAHRRGPIPSLLEIRPDVPFYLDALFRQMLAKRPDHRPQSMAEVIAGLRGRRFSRFVPTCRFLRTLFSTRCSPNAPTTPPNRRERSSRFREAD